METMDDKNETLCEYVNAKLSDNHVAKTVINAIHKCATRILAAISELRRQHVDVGPIKDQIRDDFRKLLRWLEQKHVLPLEAGILLQLRHIEEQAPQLLGLLDGKPCEDQLNDFAARICCAIYPVPVAEEIDEESKT